MIYWYGWLLLLHLMLAMERSNEKTLCLAARRGHTNTILQILETGDVDINLIPDDSDWGLKPALLEAISTNNYEIAKLLLDHGADPNISFYHGDNWDNFRPLSLAYYHGSDELIILLCEYDVDLDFEWRYRVSGGATVATFTKSVWSAGSSYKPEVLEALLEHEIRMVSEGKREINARSRIDNYSVLDRLVLFGQPEQIERAIKLGGDPNSFYYAHRTTGSGHKIHVVHPPVVNLCKYSTNFTPEKLDMLVKYGANIDTCVTIDDLKWKVFERTGRTALWYACKDPDASIIVHLIRNGADPTLSDCSGQTPLILLQKRRGSHEASGTILRALASRQVNLPTHLEVKCRSGFTALDYSMLTQDHKMIKTLLLLGSPFEYRIYTKISIPMMNLAAIWVGEFQKHTKVARNFIMKTQRIAEDYLPNELVWIILNMFITLIIENDVN